MDRQPKLGLICVGLAGERLDLAEKFHARAKDALAGAGIEIVNKADSYTTDGGQVLRQARACREAGAHALLYLAGTWLLAGHVVDAVQDVDLPAGIWGIPEPASFSSVGANVAHGALIEMNLSHRLFYGEPEDSAVIGEIARFAHACRVNRALRGARLGLLGGRCISAYPTAADANQVKALFGTEIEHVDQLVLLEKARSVPKETSRQLIERVKSTYGKVDVPEDMLIRSVNVYAALKEIIEEYSLDMCSVKCIGELMDRYCSCCLALTMLNDEGFPSGCQCNVNALLSGFILSGFSGEPVFMGDVNVVLMRESMARLINCGFIPGRLAGDLSEVQILSQYEYMGRGQGACTLFCMRGGTVTFGTLGRKNGRYVMHIAGGHAFSEPLGTLLEVRHWPQGFIRLRGDPMLFFQNLLSNHSVMGYGDHAAELKEFCALMGIETAGE